MVPVLKTGEFDPQPSSLKVAGYNAGFDGSVIVFMLVNFLDLHLSSTNRSGLPVYCIVLVVWACILMFLEIPGVWKSYPGQAAVLEFRRRKNPDGPDLEVETLKYERRDESPPIGKLIRGSRSRSLDLGNAAEQCSANLCRGVQIEIKRSREADLPSEEQEHMEMGHGSISYSAEVQKKHMEMGEKLEVGVLTPETSESRAPATSESRGKRNVTLLKRFP